MEIGLPPFPQLPFGCCVFLSQRSAFSTAPSVVASPYMLPPFVIAPMEPGVREPVIDFIVTGDLMSATESCAAGFTETGSAVGVALGVTMSVTGPTTGVSTTTSTVSSGGVCSTISSCSCSSSSSASSSWARATSTSIFLPIWPCTAVTTMRTMTPRIGTVIAAIGAIRR